MSPEFVKIAGTQFTLGGTVFPVSGVNCYFLGYCSDHSRRAVMTTAREMGANVIRSWAFLDRPAALPGAVAFQYAVGGAIVQDSSPDGLQRLDLLLATAEEFDLRLVLPFVNYWSDFGGMPQYLSWLGIEGKQDAFYRDPNVRAAYKRWVESLLTRHNSVTGRAYAEEPSVMAWELANEARCEVPGGRELLLDWIGEMSAFVKSLDRNHLLATGDEGFLKHDSTNDHLYDGSHGVDGEAILNFGEIDFGTYHFYPDTMGKPPSFGETWIRDHVASGRRANKPALLAEYGMPAGDARMKPADRRQWYARWMQAVYAAGGGGEMVWMLGSKNTDVAGFRDEFTIYSAIEVPPLGTHAEELRLVSQAARPVPGDDDAAVRVLLQTVEGDPVPVRAQDLLFLRGGTQVPFDLDGASGDFVVSAAVRDVWTVQFTTPRYLPRSSDFFFLDPGQIRIVDRSAIRDRRDWSASFHPWDGLPPEYDPLKTLLRQSAAVSLFPSGPALGLIVGPAYDALAGDAVLPKTALLNLYYKLRTLPDPLRQNDSWFSRIQQILEIGQERLIAIADPPILDSVKAVLDDPAKFGYHPAEDPELHRNFLPAEFRAEAQIFSIKASVQEASLQVTVSEIPSRGLVILDADLDEHGVLLEHIFDGLAHIFDRGTHPYDIHEFLVAQASGRGVKLDLGYTLV